jgi:hypothetical protein
LTPEDVAGAVCFRCERTRSTKPYPRGPLCDFCAQDGFGDVATATRASLEAHELVPLLEAENAKLRALVHESHVDLRVRDPIDRTVPVYSECCLCDEQGEAGVEPSHLDTCLLAVRSRTP